MNVNLEYCNPFDGKQENIWMKAEHCGRYLFAADRINKSNATSIKVLDAACADGYGTQILCGGGRIVFGADRSDDYLAIARSRNCNASFICMDFDKESMPFHDNELDVVVCFETIEHLDFPEKLVHDFSRILHSNGLLLLSFPNATYEKLDENGKNKDPYHKHIFKLEDIVHILSKTFDIKEILGQSLCNQAYSIESAAIKSAAVSQKEISSIYRYDPKAVRILSKTLAYPCSLHVNESYSYIIVAHKK